MCAHPKHNGAPYRLIRATTGRAISPTSLSSWMTPFSSRKVDENSSRLSSRFTSDFIYGTRGDTKMGRGCEAWVGGTVTAGRLMLGRGIVPAYAFWRLMCVATGLGLALFLPSVASIGERVGWHGTTLVALPFCGWVISVLMKGQEKRCI